MSIYARTYGAGRNADLPCCYIQHCTMLFHVIKHCIQDRQDVTNITKYFKVVIYD